MLTHGQQTRAIEWAFLDRRSEDEIISLYWDELTHESKKVLIKLAGFPSKFATHEFKMLTPEFKEMLKYVIRA